MAQKTVFIMYVRYRDRLDLWHKLARPRMGRRSIPFIGSAHEFDRSLQRSFRAWVKPSMRGHAGNASGAGNIGRPERCNKEW
jgi:hypothetical protein